MMPHTGTGGVAVSSALVTSLTMDVRPEELTAAKSSCHVTGIDCQLFDFSMAAKKESAIEIRYQC